MSTVLKFRPFDEYSWQMLEKRELWLPRADTLNDPYEARIKVKAKPSENQNQIEENIKMLQKQYFIASFTKGIEWKNTLLWAHYTQNSSGFAIEFNSDNMYLNRNSNLISDINGFDSTSFNFATNICEVTYRKNLIAITINIDKSNTKEVERNIKNYQKSLTSKYKMWNYESELRLIVRRMDSKSEMNGEMAENIDSLKGLKFKFKTEAIKAIYIGPNISDANQNKIIGYCANNKVALYKVFFDNNNYNFKRKKVFKMLTNGDLQIKSWAYKNIKFINET